MIRFALLFLLSLNASALQLVSVQSCLQHGSAGMFCQTAPEGYVESRVAGTYSLVFAFDAPISVLPFVVAADALRNDVPIVSTQIVGGNLIVNIQPLDTQSVEIGINTGTDFMTTQVQFLAGDINGDGTVTQADVDLVKFFTGQVTDSLNFLCDININGAVNSSDIIGTKVRIGHHL